MANLTGNGAKFTSAVRKLETSDPKHPDTWNPNYQTLIDNDVYLKTRADQVDQARAGRPSLDARLDEIEDTQQALSPDFQDAMAAALKFALTQAGVNSYGIRALREQAQQEGVLTIANRGVVKGCTITKSSTAARNLNIAGGVCFANGRAYSVADAVNAASVPSNVGSGAVTVYAYLFQDVNKLWRLAVTPVGSAVPEGAIRIYNLTVPAGSTDATDPNLSNVTVTDVRRVEAQFPQVFDSPATASISLNTLGGNDYVLAFDVLSAAGAPCSHDAITVASRATNGFTLRLSSAADSVTLRWKASRLNN